MRQYRAFVGTVLLMSAAARATYRANTTTAFDTAFHECFYSPRAPNPTHTPKPVANTEGKTVDTAITAKQAVIENTPADSDLFFDTEQFPASRAEACKAVLEADKTGCPLAYLRAAQQLLSGWGTARGAQQATSSFVEVVTVGVQTPRARRRIVPIAWCLIHELVGGPRL